MTTAATITAPAGEEKVAGAAAAAEAAKTAAAPATTTAPVDSKATNGATAPATDAKAGNAGKTADSQPVEAEGDDDGSLLDLDLDDEGDEPAKPADAKPAEGEEAKTESDKDAKPVNEGWTKERDAAADAYLKKLGKKLSHDKDGKPLSDRQRQANIDDAREKFLSRLAKYPTREAALLALIDAQNKISSGKYKAALPDDATDEEIASWRKENGIPDDAAGYKLPKVQGQEWTEADKPGLDKFLAKMHGQNANQAQVDAALSTYRELIEDAKTAHEEKLKATDKADTQETTEFLRNEYEGEFKPAMTLLKRLVGDAELFPDDAGKVLAQARDPATGKRLINNPVIAKFLIEFARDKYGDGSMISGDQQAAVNTEEQELLNLMKTDIDTYRYKPWKTTGMTASERYLEIQRKKEASGRGRRAA